jgi:peptide/nickel transport system permease protein
MRDWSTVLATSFLTSLVALAAFADWILALGWGASSGGVLPFSLNAAPAAASGSALGEWIWATRQTLATTLVVIAVALPVGTVLGSLAALQPRIFASVLTRAVEFTGALPSLIVIGLWCVGSKAPTLLGFALVVAALRSVQTARVALAQGRQALAQDFTVASWALGANLGHVFRWHVWPGLLPVLGVEAAATATYVIVIEAALGFVGLGPQGQSSWGALLGRAHEQSSGALWPAVFMIAATTLALNAVGPRQKWRERRGQGR